MALKHVYSAQSFVKAVAAVQAPGDANHWYVLQQNGVILVFDVRTPSAPATIFIDLSAETNSTNNIEAGLLGLAFDPSFSTTHRAYVFYTANSDLSGYGVRSTLSRFTSPDGGLTLDPATEERLIVRYKVYGNHNGGQLAFGPDGYLYVGVGDGGNEADPNQWGQNLGLIFGKILRLDVSGVTGYAIPPSNPFAGNAMCSGQVGAAPVISGTSCPEIYAYGFRNPWRFSFDKAAAQPDIWVGDVGQNLYEELDRVQRPGGNYGWSIKEGSSCFNPSSNCPTVGADGNPLIDPIAVAPHSAGFNAIIGGYVYRGGAIPSLVGRYLFANYAPGGIELYDSTQTNGYSDLLASTGLTISAIAQDNAGELYAVAYSTGGNGLYQFVPGTGSSSSTFPSMLSATGCVDPTDPTKPAAGLIPYTPNASFWSDGASKERWLAIPDGTQISINSTDRVGDFDFPIGTVLMKNFRLNGRLIETRLFMQHPDGVWAGYSYQWNSAQTDATLMPGGASAVYSNGTSNQTWIYPSSAQCLECHTSAAGFALGLETAQLNGVITYPQTGRSANQISTLNSIGMLTPAQTVDATTPAYVNPYDASTDLTKRARAYLHENCSQCHQPGGPTPTNLDLRYSAALSATNACNVAPAQGDLGVTGAQIITPGDSAASVLYLRMSVRDSTQMPPLATNLVDTQGAALLQNWINSLAGCN